MKIKVGDKVKFLNDTGSGIVKRILDQKTALVETEDGFEVPWMINDLVVAKGSYNPDETDSSTEEPSNGHIEEENFFSENIEAAEATSAPEDEEVLLAFQAQESSADFNTYLINSSSYQLKYTIAREEEGEVVLFQEGSLEAGIKINLGAYKPVNISDNEKFRIQGVFFNAGFFKPLSPIDMLIEISAKELYESSNWSSTDYFHEKVMVYEIHSWKEKPEQKIEINSEDLRKAMLSKGDLKKEKPEKKQTSTLEVDLHIEAITENHSGMESAEIIDIQMAKFRTSLESAIIHKSKRIVFIHGVGNGKLKHEIRRTLEHEYKKLRYQDASFAEYGYGATMILL